jgi:hypothetical protein
MNEIEIKELEAVVRAAIQSCFNSMTDEQIFKAVFNYDYIESKVAA